MTEAGQRPLLLLATILGLCLVAPLLAYSVIRLEGPRMERKAMADLAAIGALKARQIETWLDERREDARILMADDAFVADVAAWHERGDRLAQARLARKRASLNSAYSRWDLLPPDAQSSVPGGMARMARALATGRPQLSDLYGDASGRVWLDLVVPLIRHDTDVRVGVAVLGIDASTFLFPFIQTWPTPSPSAETLLCRRDGDEVLFLTGLRHGRSAPLTLRLPLATPDLPAAAALRAGPVTATLAGRDYRGVSVLAAVRPVEGTAWSLVAKMDRDEVMDPLYKLVTWVSVVAVVAVIAVAAVLWLLQRQHWRSRQLELLALTGEQDRLLKLFYDLPFMGMAVVDPVDRRWLHVNDHLCEMLGYSRDEMLAGVAWQQVCHPDDLAADAADYRRMMAGETDGYQVEMRLLRKGGGVAAVALSVRCVRKPGGEVVHVVKTVRDISERKRAEAALREREEDLQRAQALGHIGSWRLNVVRNELTWSAENHRIFGVPEGTALSYESFLACVHPDDRAYVERRWRAALAGEPYDIEHRLLVDHQVKWVRERAELEFGEAGDLLGAFGTTQDITDTKAAAQALRESEERFHLAAEIGRAGTWDWNVRTGEIVWSRGHYDILGYRPGEIEPDYRAWAERVHPDDLPRVEAEILRCREERAPYTAEFRVVWPDGTVHWMIARGRYDYGEDGTCERMLGVMADVTTLKQAELALREADQRKDEFLAMLAHELRNPLAPIRNAAHILGRLDVAEPRVRWVQEVIENQVGQLTRLVDELLDIARIARGKILLRMTTVDLAEIVRQACESVAPLVAAKGHRLEVRLPDRPVALEGDRVRLIQVLQNLLNNAAKYTPDGGHIELAGRVEGEEVVIEVRDDGIGLSPDLLEGVFDLFRQGDRSLDRAEGGLGIGLTLVRQLVELHGGRVVADSPGPGRGTTFTVHLPASRSAALAGPADPAPAAPGRSLRVLVVDDEASVAESMLVFLELEGHQGRSAGSGTAALALMTEFRPEVVLLDIGLPGQDGYAVAQAMRRHPDGAGMTLIAVSGYGHEEAVARSRAAGFDRHLVKPVDPEVLAGLLAQVASRRMPCPA